MSELALPNQFRGFAVSAARDGATTYAAICLGVAEDPELLALIAEAPLAQRRPNLLLAATHFLLLGGAEHHLAAHYDSVMSMTGREPGVPSESVSADFRDFCLHYRTPLLELIATRSTQTNEVGRCAVLLPALSWIAGHYPIGQPLSLLDLGTSAGLNLLFDRYRYQFRPRSGSADSPVRRAGDPGSEVILECVVRGDPDGLPLLHPPTLASRTGLDRAPIDPTTEDGARWLLACQWPDNLPRFNRLRAALTVASTTTQRPTLHQGDMVDDLARVATTIPEDGPLVVFHSWVAAYLTHTRQAELVAAVEALASNRPVHYLYAESPAETPGLPTPPSPQPRVGPDHATAMVHLGMDSALAIPSSPVRLADMHPHGKWVQWWPTGN